MTARTFIVEPHGPRAGIYCRSEADRDHLLASVKEAAPRADRTLGAVHYSGLPVHVCSPAEWDRLQVTMAIAEQLRGNRRHG